MLSLRFSPPPLTRVGDFGARSFAFLPGFAARTSVRLSLRLWPPPLTPDFAGRSLALFVVALGDFMSLLSLSTDGPMGSDPTTRRRLPPVTSRRGERSASVTIARVLVLRSLWP